MQQYNVQLYNLRKKNIMIIMLSLMVTSYCTCGPPGLIMQNKLKEMANLAPHFYYLLISILFPFLT